ncbi:hypothetical protein G9C98_002202 [Cotesia typhae]|uniref:Uncharacterized protein n=1 Tax=Cotesia typhae TaxID=2053667 RepID=A0A8J5RJF4_9HYME|nr:hypothetical protein G9C98_002202 [Cotesia typhae]
MRFIYYFYITLIYFCERAWIIRGSTDLSIAELRHLSEKLHPEQCVKVLESLYLRTPGYTLKDEKKLHQLTSEQCQLKLEQWNHIFPAIIIYKRSGKTRKVPLSQVPMCHPSCGGYNRFPQNVEDGWMSSKSDLPQAKCQRIAPVSALHLPESEPEKKPVKKPERKKPEKKRPEKKPEKKKRQSKQKSSEKLVQKVQEVKQVEKIVKTETKVKENEKDKRVQKEQKEKRKTVTESEETDVEAPKFIDGPELREILEHHTSTCSCCKCRANLDGTTDERTLCSDKFCNNRKTSLVMNRIKPFTNEHVRKSSWFKNRAKTICKFSSKKLSQDKEKLSLPYSPVNTATEGWTTESPPVTKRKSSSKSPPPLPPPPSSPPPPPPPPPPLPKEQKRESKTRKSSTPQSSSKSPSKSSKKSLQPCVKNSCSTKNSSPRNSRPSKSNKN